jgi:hypothetical protein
VLIRLASITTTSAGTASRTNALTAAQVNLILAAPSGTGKIAIRVGSGTTAKCRAFAKRTVPGPQAVVQSCYDWYLAQVSTGTIDLHRRLDVTSGFITWFEG